MNAMQSGTAFSLVDMASKRRAYRFVCHTCLLRFALYVPAIPKRKPSCPFCADNTDVTTDTYANSYDPRTIPGKELSKIRWTAEEDAELIRLYNAKTMPLYAIAKEMGRGNSAVRARCSRMRKQGLIK